MQKCLITIIRRDSGINEGTEWAEDDFLAMCWINERIKHDGENHPFAYRLEWDGRTKEIAADDFKPITNRYGEWE